MTERIQLVEIHAEENTPTAFNDAFITDDYIKYINDAGIDNVNQELLSQEGESASSNTTLANQIANNLIHKFAVVLDTFSATENITLDPTLRESALKDVRKQIFTVKQDLYLRNSDSDKATPVQVGRHTWKATKLTHNKGKTLNSLDTLKKNGLNKEDPLYRLLTNEKKVPKQTSNPASTQETSFSNPASADQQVESTENLIKRLADARNTLINATDTIRTARTIEEIIRPLEQAREMSNVFTAEDRQMITKYLDFVKQNYNKKNQLIADIEANKKIIADAERDLATERKKASIEENKIDELEKKKTDAEANIQTSKQLLDQILAYNERLYEDVSGRLRSKFTLGQKIGYIFRKYGLTVAAIILALGVIADTVILAMGASAAAGIAGGGAGGVVKKALTSFANWLLELGKKALSNLPSIIGAIASFLLNLLASIIGFVAQNLWVLLVAGAIALYEAIKVAYYSGKK